MLFHQKVVISFLLSMVATTDSFSTNPLPRASTALRSESIESTMEGIRDKYQYKAGGAQTNFAQRFRHLADVEVKTVGESFADFTETFGRPVNPLYKNMITDLVGTTHLTVVNARFERSPVWSFGLVAVLDLLLKNYPEPDNKVHLVSAFFSSLGLDEATVRSEAAATEEWAKSVSRQDIEAALTGEGSSELAKVAVAAKADPFWLYSRYFGIGLLKIMECTGVEMEKDEAYPIMEDWMKNKFGRSADSDLYFKVREKLDMMETMMKEIEIREKKRMANRLEEKAEAALRAADREEEFKKEAEKEAEPASSS